MSPFARADSTYEGNSLRSPSPGPYTLKRAMSPDIWFSLRHQPQQWGAGSEHRQQIPGEPMGSLPRPCHLDAAESQEVPSESVSLVSKSCDKSRALTHPCSQFARGPSSASSPVGSSHAWIISKMLKWVCTTHSPSPKCICTPSHSTYRTGECEMWNAQTT